MKLANISVGGRECHNNNNNNNNNEQVKLANISVGGRECRTVHDPVTGRSAITTFSAENFATQVRKE